MITKIPITTVFNYDLSDGGLNGSVSFAFERGEITFNVMGRALMTEEDYTLEITHGEEKVVTIDNDLRAEMTKTMSPQSKAGLLIFTLIGEKMMTHYAESERLRQGRMGRLAKEGERLFGAEMSTTIRHQGEAKLTEEQVAYFDSFTA